MGALLILLSVIVFVLVVFGVGLFGLAPLELVALGLALYAAAGLVGYLPRGVRE